MPQGKYTGVFSAAIFILLEVAALAMLHGSHTLQDIWINRFSHRTMAMLWGSGERLRSYLSLDRQNKELARENLALSTALMRYRAQEIRQEEEAQLPAPMARFRFIPASIVRISRNSQHNYIILNKGWEDGVRARSGIITNEGVVGIIDAVDRHYSYGITFLNPLLSISARVGRNGIVGPLEWNGRASNRAVLRELPAHYDVAPGDTVWTSGFSAMFPPDIPLGVTGKSRLSSGSTNEVDVTLFLDFGALRYVTIVDNPDREEIAELERMEEEGV